MHDRRYTAEQEAKLDRKGDDQEWRIQSYSACLRLGRPNGDQVDPILDAFSSKRRDLVGGENLGGSAMPRAELESDPGPITVVRWNAEETRCPRASHRTTVMGRGSESSSSRGIADPPRFSPRQDLYAWRKSVENWVDLISVGASKGEDKHCKTVFATLGGHLYDRALPLAQECTSIMHRRASSSITSKMTKSQPYGKSSTLSLSIPLLVVITRLINSFNKVVKCKRNKNESLTQFVSRFHGLAFATLDPRRASSSSQVGEVLAITLLGNANLGETTHQSAKIQYQCC